MPLNHRIPLCILAWLFLLGGSSAGRADVVLTATTSEPEHCTYVPGQPVVLKFRITGLPADTRERLNIHVADEHGNTVSDDIIPLVIGTSKSTRVGFEDAAWQVETTSSVNRLGFFQVFAKLDDGTAISPSGGRGGYLTFAIMPDPFQRKQYEPEETFFGLMCARGATEPLMGAALDLFNYQTHHWRRFEPENGGQFKKLIEDSKGQGDKIIGALDEMHHFTVNGKPLQWRHYNIPFLFCPPTWAEVPGTRGHMTATLNPAGERGWEAFSGQIAGLYAKTYPNESMQRLEITTEPVFGWGFQGKPEDLVRIHELAYKAIHQASPKAVVGGPTFTGVGNGEDWNFVDMHRKVFEAGIGKYLDILHIHPYVGQPEECQFVQKIRAIKKIMRDTVGHELPMAGTEGGYSYVGETRENWLNKAWSDVRSNLIMMGEGFRYSIAFYGNGATDPNSETWGYYMCLDSELKQFNPTPVAPAYSAMTFLLEGHKSSGAIEWLGDTALGYSYQRDDDIVLAVWDWSGKPRQVEIPVGTDHAIVYDWMGNKTTVASPKGVLTLTLTRDPQYIKGVSSALWGRDSKKALSLRDKPVEVFPGNALDLTVFARDVDGKGLNGRVVLKASSALELPEQSQELNVASAEETRIDFKTSIPASTPPGTYAVALVLEQDNVARSAAGCMVRVLAPVELTRIRPVVNKDGFGVSVDLKAATDSTGTLSVSARGTESGSSSKAFTLKAGVHAQQVFSLANAGLSAAHLSEIDVAMETSAGSRLSLSKRLSFMSAVTVTNPIVADGDLTDWAGIPSVKIAAPDALRVPASFWSGADDLSAEVWLAWDASALYIAFDVIDDFFVQEQTGWATWKDDCVQIGLNLDPEQVRAGAMSTIEAGGMRRWQELDIALTSNGPEVYRTMSYDNRFCPSEQIDARTAARAVKKSGHHLIYELAIPWKTFGTERAPNPGECIGFACSINDRDPGKETLSILGLFDGVTNGKDIGKYGWVVLRGSEDGK